MEGGKPPSFLAIGKGTNRMLPKETNMFLPFLKILSESPRGTATTRKVARVLADRYYELITELDRISVTESGSYWYLQRVRYVKKKLEHDKGWIVFDERTQRCTITDDGKETLRTGWTDWVPEYSDSELPEGMTVRHVRDEDPLLESDVISDEDVISNLKKVHKILQGASNHQEGEGAEERLREAVAMVGHLIEDIDYRGCQK
jgi:hypothetical protein